MSGYRTHGPRMTTEADQHPAAARMGCLKKYKIPIVAARRCHLDWQLRMAEEFLQKALGPALGNVTVVGVLMSALGLNFGPLIHFTRSSYFHKWFI